MSDRIEPVFGLLLDQMEFEILWSLWGTRKFYHHYITSSSKPYGQEIRRLYRKFLGEIPFKPLDVGDLKFYLLISAQLCLPDIFTRFLEKIIRRCRNGNLRERISTIFYQFARMFILRNDALMLETLCKVLRGRNFKRISFEWLKAVRLTIKYKCQHLITILTRDWSNPISKKDEDDLLPILYHYRGPGFHAIHQNPDLLDFNDDMYEYDYDGVVNYQVFMLLSYRPKYLKCYGFIADSLMKLGPGPVSDQYLSVISRRNRLIKNLRLIGWSPLDEFIRRFSMKILCQIEATIKSGESLKHVHYLYGPAMIVYAAARLRRKDLVEKYVDEMRVVGSDELSVETFMINAVQGGDWEIIRWFPNWMDIIYDTTCVARDGRILYYLAAMENAQDVIDSILNRSEDPKAFHLELLQGYLASGNYEKVIETSKLITDLMDSDDLLVVIRCDNLSCLEYVEKHWGVIDLDLISSSRFDIHRLTEVLWTLINRDDDTLWRYVFEKLLKTDDFNGLVRITEKFNPKMLSDEEPFDEVIKCTLEGHQFYNSHYLIWLTENCNNSTIIS